MGLNYRKKVSLNKEYQKLCINCNITYPNSANFCSICGTKLKLVTFETYANISNAGITSISCKTPSGTINSKGKISVPIGNGITFTSNLDKKKTTSKKRKN